jgi:hypothetical protein
MFTAIGFSGMAVATLDASQGHSLLDALLTSHIPNAVCAY